MVSEQLVVQVQRPKPHVALVLLNRPERRNAINGEMVQLLEAATLALEADEEVRAVVMSSTSDKVFCSGADLSEVAAGRQSSLVTDAGGFAGFVRHPKSKPWIAAMNGHAIAGGLEMALACHLRVVGDSAQLALPEPRYGMLAGAGGVDRLPRLVPRAVAIELLCTGMPIDAQRALQVGLVNHVVPDGQATAKALELAGHIASNAPLAVQASLRFAELVDERSASDLLCDMKIVQQSIYASDDFREGIAAFAEKREPVWQGC